MKTSITRALSLFAGAAMLLGVSTVQAITYTAGVVYEGNFNEAYLNGSPLLAKFEINDSLASFGGEFEPGIMGDSYMDAHPRSNRSAFITLVQAATKSRTNFSRLSSWA
jgi:hypothetical protein